MKYFHLVWAALVRICAPPKDFNSIVRTLVQFQNTPNELAGSFTLLLDRKPTSGQETRIEVESDPIGEDHIGQGDSCGDQQGPEPHLQKECRVPSELPACGQRPDCGFALGDPMKPPREEPAMAQHFRIEAQGLVLIVHVHVGQFDLHERSPVCLVLVVALIYTTTYIRVKA